MPFFRIASLFVGVVATITSTAANASWLSEITGINIDIPNATISVEPPKPQAIVPMLQNLPKDAAQALLNPAGSALATAIRISRRTAGDGAQTIPPEIRAQLAPFFPAEVLDHARYNTNKAAISLPAAINLVNEGNSVTLDDLIVFSDGGAASNPVMWAHELTHVMQYMNMGVEGFANVYSLTGGSQLESQAREMEGRVRTALSNPGNSAPLTLAVAPGAFAQPLTVNAMQQQAQAAYPASNCGNWQPAPGGAIVQNMCPIPIMVTSFTLMGPYGPTPVPCTYNCVVMPGVTMPFGGAVAPVVGFNFVY